MLRLRDLRKHRGRFASLPEAKREIARLLALLPATGPERAVFLAIEVEGRPYKQVAHDLNMSERHLYRVRRKMMEALAAGFATLESPVRPLVDHTVGSAHRALEHGDAPRACALLRQAIGRGFDSNDTLVQALALQVRAQADCGREDAAQLALDDLRRAVNAAEESHESAARELAHAQSYLYLRRGLYRKALEYVTNPKPVLHEMADAHAQLRYARTLIFTATLHQEEGSPEIALAVLSQAERLLERLTPAPAAESAQIATLRAFCLGADPNRLNEAHDSAASALSLAAWHGLTLEYAWARITQAWLCAAAGPFDDGLAYAKEAAECASQTSAGDQLARILLISARLHGRSGNHREALASIEAAAEAAKHWPWLSAVAASSYARTLAGNGQSDAALAAATSYIDAYEHLNDSPYQGFARFARAAALWKRGIRSDEDIEAALHYFDRGGALRDRIDAYALSAAMTGNRRHAQLSDVLKSRLLA